VTIPESVLYVKQSATRDDEKRVAFHGDPEALSNRRESRGGLKPSGNFDNRAESYGLVSCCE